MKLTLKEKVKDLLGIKMTLSEHRKATNRTIKLFSNSVPSVVLAPDTVEDWESNEMELTNMGESLYGERLEREHGLYMFNRWLKF